MIEHKKLSRELYSEICSLLDIDPNTDRKTVEFLDSKLDIVSVEQAYKKLTQLLSHRIAFIFGAGPSLPTALIEVQPILKKFKDKITVIAVDGATKALQEQDISIDIIVSDLDGGVDSIKNELERETLIVIHAHGDNQNKIEQFFKRLDNTINIIGTSQSFETGKIKNLGGFTDGDRAVYLAANFNTKLAVLFAFDFGNKVGKYSKPDIFTEDVIASERKKIKLDFAKKLLAILIIDFPKCKILNCTPHGEEIPNVQKITFSHLEEILKEQY